MTQSTSTDEVLTPREAAQFLKVDYFTLSNWRTKGMGPAYFKLGGERSQVRYRRSAIEAWIQSRPKVTPEAA